MANIWLISDTHFNHNRDFILQPRGFTTVNEMNEAIIQRWNDRVKPDDIVYHLGDVIMGDLNSGIELIKRLNGHIKLAIGNHDTPARIEAFKSLFDDIQFGYRIIKKKKVFLLTHYPQITGNYDNSQTYSIHGHTHSLNPFNEDYLMYNVSCEAHFCTPILFEEAIEQIRNYKNFYKSKPILDINK